MQAIWKTTLRVEDEQTVTMPLGFEILAVQMQHGAVCLWAIVHTAAIPEQRTIYMRGTGHQMNGKEGRYLGTIQLQDGALIFHVFEALDENVLGIGNVFPLQASVREAAATHQHRKAGRNALSTVS